MSSFKIVAREDFSEVTYLLELRHPLMARAARPGQFVIAMLHEQGARIPLTIGDFDRGKGTITLVIQAVGKTTRQMQQECRGGTSLYGMVGPMSHAKKVVCVGGRVPGSAGHRPVGIVHHPSRPALEPRKPDLEALLRRAEAFL